MRTLSTALAIALISSIALAQAQPLEIAVHSADMVIAVTVDDVGEPEEMTLTLPGDSEPTTGRFRLHKLTALKVYKPLPSAATSAPVERKQKFEVISHAITPATDGDTLHIGRSELSHPRLQPGQNYALILHKLPGRDEYLLKSDAQHWRPVSEFHVKSIHVAVNQSRWAWGKAADGLQVALIPTRTEKALVLRQDAADKPGRVVISAVFALKNASDKPLAVNLNPALKPLSITATDESGEQRDLRVYITAGPQKPPSGTHLVTLKPGEIVFAGPGGEANEGFRLMLTAMPGACTLQGHYEVQPPTDAATAEDAPVESTPAADAAAGEVTAGAAATDTQPGESIAPPRLWTGKASSAAVEIELRPDPMPRKR